MLYLEDEVQKGSIGKHIFSSKICQDIFKLSVVADQPRLCIMFILNLEGNDGPAKSADKSSPVCGGYLLLDGQILFYKNNQDDSQEHILGLRSSNKE